MLLENVSVRNLVLFFGASCGYVPRRYVRVFTPALTYPHSAIQSALKNDLITITPLIERVSYKKRKDEYIQLTTKGFRYLSEHADKFPDELRWVGAIYKEAIACKIVRENCVNDQDKMRRYLSVVGATIFTAASGCQVSTPFPQSRTAQGRENEEGLFLLDDGIGSDGVSITDIETGSEQSMLPRKTQAEIIEEIIRNKNEPEQNLNGVIFNRGSELIFTNSYEMKRLISSTRVDTTAYMSGRFTGVVESPLKSVLMYEGRRTGIGWSKWQTEYDLKPYRLFSIGKSHYRNFKADRQLGAMLVKNAKMFSDLMHDKAGKRKTGERFAEGFSSFIIFPIDYIGTVQFSAYMSTDMKEYHAGMIESAVLSGFYQRNSGMYPTVFPLKSNSGIPTTVGTFIDAIKIQKILSILEASPFQFGVICYEWQCDYYRRVFPETVEYFIVK